MSSISISSKQHLPQIVSTYYAPEPREKNKFFVADPTKPKLTYSIFEDLILGDTSDGQFNLRTVFWFIATLGTLPILASYLRNQRIEHSKKIAEILQERSFSDCTEMSFTRQLSIDEVESLLDVMVQLAEINRWVNPQKYFDSLNHNDGRPGSEISLKDSFEKGDYKDGQRQPETANYKVENSDVALKEKCTQLLGDDHHFILKRGALFYREKGAEDVQLMSCSQYFNVFMAKHIEDHLHLATDLCKIDLSDVNLSKKNIEDTLAYETIILSQANLKRGNFFQSTVNNVDLTGVEASDSDWSFAHVQNADFSNATMHNVKLVGTKFGENVNFDNATITLNLPTVWTRHTLKQHFNYHADENPKSRSLLTAIDSISNSEVKIALMLQTVRSLKNVKSEDIQTVIGYFQEILGSDSAYVHDTEIMNFIYYYSMFWKMDTLTEKY
ncbi:MAG: hypothetical protein K0R08_1202 [Solimicrobium sp.]|jgi:hypothetical protein|nr:hypothetical protein [Solimicrobium sp.]